MALSWYINRIKTFTLPEFFYRVCQRYQTHIKDKKIFSKSKSSEINLNHSEIIDNTEAHFSYSIFDYTIDIYKPIDWHIDLSSKKRFPLTFAHQINIRSDQFGSAKYVWEVNRLLFLIQIASDYKKTKENKFLDLLMYHIASWNNENPYLVGVNWYSNIEVNIRLINWHYCWKLIDAESLKTKNESFRKFVEDVWFPLIENHAEYSYKHPSLYSSANNHLISEYTGLYVATSTWNLRDRKKRFVYAQKGLEREIQKQHTEEGVNREEAAEYIQFINDFFLVAAIVGKENGTPFSHPYEKKLHQIAGYLNKILDSKENYPMYGDGDDGYVLRPGSHTHFNNFSSELSTFAAYFDDSTLKRSSSKWDDKSDLMLGVDGKLKFEKLMPAGNVIDSCFFPKSGHFIFRKRKEDLETYMHFDAAPLGFLSIAAHGHADALSFILHVDGSPIFIDSGTYTYHTHREWREYFVGTIAHNTIRVNGKNQADLAGPTLWLNHYKNQILAVKNDSEMQIEKVIASHDGYKKQGVTPIREIEFNRKKEEFLITDILTG
ncbi:MAG: hypothetical protein GX638_10475, partial [Crenarchaeota archaeon]|nr:hypothetical protein [Thermoproteota archaeon]